MAAASQLEEWMKPPSRQRSPLLATVRAMASLAPARETGQRDQRHPLGEADGIEAGDLLPASGASAVNQSTWLRKWVTPFAAARASAVDARR